MATTAPAAGPIMNTISVADGIQGKGGPPLVAVGQDAQGLAHHAEDGQGQQAADEHQRQEPLVGHVRNDGPDDRFGDDGRDQRRAQADGVHPPPAPRCPDSDADGHHGRCGTGSGVALAQGEDDVQGQQHARRRMRNAGNHAHQQEPPDGPDGQQLPVQSEIHEKGP